MSKSEKRANGGQDYGDLARLLRDIVQDSGAGQAPMSDHLRGLVSKAYGLACFLDPCLRTVVKHDAETGHWEGRTREIKPPDGEAGRRSHYLRWATSILCHHLKGRAIDGDESDRLLEIAAILEEGSALPPFGFARGTAR
jgi:hypothetical protein